MNDVDISSLPQHAQDNLRPTPVQVAGRAVQVPAGLVAEIRATLSEAASTRRRGQSGCAARMVSDLRCRVERVMRTDANTARLIIRSINT